MIKRGREMTDEKDGAQLALDRRVRVYPGTDAESRGIVVDDFGTLLDVRLISVKTISPIRRVGGQYYWTPVLLYLSTATNSRSNDRKPGQPRNPQFLPTKILMHSPPIARESSPLPSVADERTTRTVEGHSYRTMTKTGTTTRDELIRLLYPDR
jgi:hypothetical protein